MRSGHGHFCCLMRSGLRLPSTPIAAAMHIEVGAIARNAE